MTAEFHHVACPSKKTHERLRNGPDLLSAQLHGDRISPVSYGELVVVRQVKDLPVYLVLWRIKELFNLKHGIADVAKTFRRVGAAGMEVASPRDHLEELSVGYVWEHRPRPPGRGGADDAPGALHCGGVLNDLLACHFALGIEGIRTIVVHRLGAVIRRTDKLGRCENAAYHRGLLRDGADHVLHPLNVSAVAS